MTLGMQACASKNIYHIGNTKSGQELEVFLTMPLERLRLGCGIQCTETMLPLGPTKSWVGQVALRSPINRHAVDPFVSLDDQGH